MENKVCITCNKEKIVNEFELRSDTKKRRNQCKECRNNYVKNYKEGRQLGTIVKKEIVVDDQGKKQCIKCLKMKELAQFPQRKTEHGYRHECLDCKKTILNDYYHRVYNEVRRNRKSFDVEYRLLSNHRNYVYKCLTKFKNKTSYSLKYLCCNLTQFKLWLEFQFDEEMTWNNYGDTWTLDHNLPLSQFDLIDVKQQDIAFNWKNTQPSIDNFVKGNQIRCYEYYNSIVTAHRFIINNNLEIDEYQGICESKNWLRDKLRNGKNLIDEGIIIKVISEMGDPQPSS